MVTRTTLMSSAVLVGSMNLLKIKSVVTLLLVGTLVIIVLLGITVNESAMALLTASVGAAIGSLFAKHEKIKTEEVKNNESE